jgi:hypothetical protein
LQQAAALVVSGPAAPCAKASAPDTNAHGRNRGRRQVGATTVTVTPRGGSSSSPVTTERYVLTAGHGAGSLVDKGWVNQASVLWRAPRFSLGDGAENLPTTGIRFDIADMYFVRKRTPGGSVRQICNGTQ